MAAVSGRAGLFTINPLNPNLYDQVEAQDRAQKSGALRLEFGKVRIPTAATTAESVRTTVNTGIMALATPAKISTATAMEVNFASGAGAVSGVFQISAFYLMGGYFGVMASGSFLSGYLHMDIVHTGSFSDQASGMEVNYMVVGH